MSLVGQIKSKCSYCNTPASEPPSACNDTVDRKKIAVENGVDLADGNIPYLIRINKNESKAHSDIFSKGLGPTKNPSVPDSTIPVPTDEDSDSKAEDESTPKKKKRAMAGPRPKKRKS